MNDDPPDMPPPVRRPIGSTLVAWGFVLISVLALVSMGQKLLQGRISFHFGVLLFPVALGLFHGRVSAILWARIQGGFMAALGGVFLLLYPFVGTGYNVHLLGHQLHGWPRHALVVGMCSVTICLGIAIWRAVSSRAHLNYVVSKGGFSKYSPAPGG